MASDSRSMARHLMSGSGVSKSAMSCPLDNRRCNQCLESTNQTRATGPTMIGLHERCCHLCRHDMLQHEGRHPAMMKLFWKQQRMAKLWILSRSESWGFFQVHDAPSVRKGSGAYGVANQRQWLSLAIHGGYRGLGKLLAYGRCSGRTS